MPVIDTFPRNARWDTAGISCSSCIHFGPPASWPDTEKKISCRLHEASLANLLADTGYMRCESFCVDLDYNQDGRIYHEALNHLREIKSKLSPGVLYCLHEPGKPLEEIRIRKEK